MVTQSMNASKLEQLPAEARDRIEQLRLLFIERSRGHLVQIQALLAKRQVPGETRTADAELTSLAHTLVGTSGIFSFQALGEAALKLENTLRQTGYRETDFVHAMDGLVQQLDALG